MFSQPKPPSQINEIGFIRETASPATKIEYRELYFHKDTGKISAIIRLTEPAETKENSPTFLNTAMISFCSPISAVNSIEKILVTNDAEIESQKEKLKDAICFWSKVHTVEQDKLFYVRHVFNDTQARLIDEHTTKGRGFYHCLSNISNLNEDTITAEEKALLEAAELKYKYNLRG